jgi:hypothetical protein
MHGTSVLFILIYLLKMPQGDRKRMRSKSSKQPIKSWADTKKN